MGDYWFTTLSAVRRGEPDWEAVAAYEGPVRRFLDERWRAIPPADRDDIAQEILVALHERLVAGYDPAKGPFRPFLRAAIGNRVRDWLRRRRPAGADAVADLAEAAEEPADDDADAIDLEAEVVRAVRSVHDAYAHGPRRDRALVYVLAGALVDGLSNEEIARRERLSIDQVKRALQRARGDILAALFGRLLGADRDAPETARAADLARACLREPRREARLLEDERDGRVRQAVGAFLERLRRARAGFLAGDVDFVRGVRTIFEVS